jgi:HTH-type transcriptional regulator / antitoxin HigA
MTLTFDQATYADLLAETVPQVIETENEYERALAAAEQLTFSKRTAEQTALYRLLVMLVEAYEAEHYALEESAPHEILQHLMEASGTRQADLVGMIGTSGVVSEVVNGKRSISKTQAKLLGQYFKISPSLFI